LIEKTPAPSLVFRMIKRHSVTRLNVGPYLLNAMCASKNKFNLTGTKIICSGEYLSDDLRAKTKQHLGSSVFDTYGATEVWTTISFQNDPTTNDTGEILEGVEAKIVNGELHIKHPVQAMGYWNADDLTRKVFQKDWVATGDAVEINNNRIKFLGRIDDMIKIKGTFVSLFDIEDAIKSCPAVEECVVVVDSSDAIQTLVAKVKFTSNDGSISTLRKYLRGILPSDKIPKQFYQVTELPKTINNKLKRKLARLKK
jgi:acyl-coenzyme A synthetase/AMP-(fatty) acid ligase